MSEVRIRAIQATIFVLALLIALAAPTVLESNSDESTIMLRVAVIFLFAIGLGLTGQSVRLNRARARLEELKAELPTATLFFTAFWGPPLWAALKLDQQPVPMLGARWIFESVAVTVDSVGVAFWTGKDEPQCARRIPWKEIKDVETGGIQARGKRYSAIGLCLITGERIPLQIASTTFSLWPLASGPELEKVRGQIAGARPQNLAHPRADR